MRLSDERKAEQQNDNGRCVRSQELFDWMQLIQDSVNLVLRTSNVSLGSSCGGSIIEKTAIIYRAAASKAAGVATVLCGIAWLEVFQWSKGDALLVSRGDVKW